MQLLPMRDPRTMSWFGAGDWILLIYILGLYVGIVKVILPKYMAKRKEFDLLGYIRCYNLLLVAINAVFAYKIARRSYFGGGYSWFCQGLDLGGKDTTLLQLNYLYMFVRIFEFSDTVFFVLRKKFNQATFLNISHHCIAVGLPWYGVAYGIDGQICLMVLFNMVVHVIMYSYYFLASFQSMVPYLGWKKHLTKLQILQFAVVLVHMSIPIYHDCGYPPQNSILVISMYAYFLVMFTKFYGSTYSDAKKSLPETNGSIARANTHKIK
ncbi:elongation of very long chain fatty acids protein 5-like [Galendromus occidentalis]|uniref:Elongation of very long chain fatty acids protein n=1 Tax=Galendromus occidentalis TaxID=34638 RepID=A0AAJ6QW07_9ACAR|nr:elongation of very long chain fatty acids protein 5-like [Galendromus occidentalis]